MAQILVYNAHGKDHVERASLAFVVGNAALTAGQEATVVLTTEGVWLPTQGYTEGLQANGFAPLGELVQKFLSSGGRLWACGSCTKPRGITQEHLIEGAQIVGAATIVEAIVNGAQTLSV